MAGHFSSRVMNMKFMQMADEKEGQKHEEQKIKKLKDLCEWKLPNSEVILAKYEKRRPKVNVVGYTAIMGGVGRRNFGFVEKEESTEAVGGDVKKEAGKNTGKRSKALDEEVEKDKESVKPSNRCLLDIWTSDKKERKEKSEKGSRKRKAKSEPEDRKKRSKQ